MKNNTDKTGEKSTNTPLMRQYFSVKAKYPNAMLLFRVGDFYETYSDDAVSASEILGIVLTHKSNGNSPSVEMAGFPYHALDVYLPKLVKAGLKVAICDQLEDPKLTKTIVKRDVTELVTPGVSYNDKTFDQNSNNFLACVHLTSGNSHGIALLDVSTGEFFTSQGDRQYIDKILQSFRPNEVIVQKKMKQNFTEYFGNKIYLTTFDDWVFTYEFGYEELTKHFQTNTLKGFGIEDMQDAIIAAGGIIHYLYETNHDKTDHITSISRLDEDKYVWLDRFTINSLELISTPNENAKTLLDIIDKTVSPPGSRLMRRWVVMPLNNIEKINERLDIVDYFTHNEEDEYVLRDNIKAVGDIERIAGKIATGRINPREIVHLKDALNALKPIKDRCFNSGVIPLVKLSEKIDVCQEVIDMIQTRVKDDPSTLIEKCGVIRDGFNSDLDDLRHLTTSSKDYLTAIQKRETARTGISSLKIGFNNVFGYYLEVTNTHKEKVPEDWVRKQTLVNSERYITQELKDLESKILSAESKISEIEQRLYIELIRDLAGYIKPLQQDSYVVSHLDCLLSFAIIAAENGYTRPEINDSMEIKISDGRHPVIEKMMPQGESYIANDIFLDAVSQQIMMITGPNMSGKSALLRQTALIVIMAQMGSFVPAKSAVLGLTDKIFTRVGASDNISSGESTFMVEMNETASILNNLSNRSLILLDEIGRGTSTYDGISIAWAIAEYIHDNLNFRPKVLFATHYHELNEMASTKKRIKNYHVTVREVNNKILFLRKLAKGGTEHSFGIHVAKMAGMPAKVINRANEILHELEESQRQSLQDNKEKGSKNHPTVNPMQISLIQMEDPLLSQIKNEILNIDINSLTPIEALMKLNEIKKVLIKF